MTFGTHNLICPLASCLLLELDSRLPAIRLVPWRPLVTVRALGPWCGTDPARTEARSRPVADAGGAPVLRDQGPDQPAGHGTAELHDPVLTIRVAAHL